MKPLLTSVPLTLPLLLLSVGCASEISPGEDPVDSGLEPAISPGAQLSTLSFIQLPESRPYVATFVYGGDVSITGKYRGEGWTLAFAPALDGSLEEAQPILTKQTSSEAMKELAATWPTAGFTETGRAGTDPLSDDAFTLYLNAWSTSANGETRYDKTDAIQVKLDNTAPISRITRICRDSEGINCFGFTTNPADVGASNSATDILQISSSSAPKLYVYGIARDKNFTRYLMAMVGGQASNGSLLCSSDAGQNSGCVGEAGTAPDAFGYGIGRSLNYQETLSGTELIDAYSEDALLLVWDVSYLTPDAYALNLVSYSSAYVNGDDDPFASSNWVTLLIEQ